MNIQQACKEQAPEIASLIMEAMHYECCQNFAGPHHSFPSRPETACSALPNPLRLPAYTDSDSSLSGFSANFHTPGLNQPVRLPP